MRKRLIIFDWDGTLMDSADRIISSLQAASQDIGLTPPDSEAIRAIIGLSFCQALPMLFPEEPSEAHQEIRQRYRDHFFNLCPTPMALFPETRSLLKSLLDANFLLAVATGKSRVGLNHVLVTTKTEHLFHTTRCADETRSKPHPQMLLEILAELDVPPKDAIMVGDSTFDLEMAARASIDSIAVTHGVHVEEELALHDPVLILEDLKNLLAYLKR